MNDALNDAARTGQTHHSQILAVQYAKLINLMSGGTVIAPWEVDQLDEEWLNVFFGLLDLPKRRESYQAFERRLIQRRNEHPNYRKYLQ